MWRLLYLETAVDILDRFCNCQIKALSKFTDLCFDLLAMCVCVERSSRTSKGISAKRYLFINLRQILWHILQQISILQTKNDSGFHSGFYNEFCGGFCSGFYRGFYCWFNNQIYGGFYSGSYNDYYDRFRDEFYDRFYDEFYEVGKFKLSCFT